MDPPHDDDNQQDTSDKNNSSKKDHSSNPPPPSIPSRDSDEEPTRSGSLPPAPDPDQIPEYASTIDPSHIIHLIRQLLPVETAPNSNAEDDPEPNGKEEACTEGLDSAHKLECRVVVDSEETTEAPATEPVENDPKGYPHEESEEGKNDPREKWENDAEDLGDVGVQNRNGDINPKPELCEQEELREEAGCVLWDLAANESQAEFLVENRILEVLLAILCLPQSDRMREICLGILGNLACHSTPVKILVNFEGLVQTVIHQLQFEDPPSLCETCRLLSAGLHSDAASAWIRALQQEEVLERIMWIVANTMNSQLREKSTELLLAIVDSKQEAFCALLPILLKKGLPELLTDLIECEVTAITEGTSTSGDAVLDIVLQIAEALSLSDEFAARLASNQQLFSLACQVIRLSQKDEIGPSGITATVLIANLLTENNSLIGDFLQDGSMVAYLLGLLPSVSEDSGARNALWSILQRVCQHVQARQVHMSSDAEANLIAALADGSNLLMYDLDNHRDEDELEDEARASDVAPSCGRQAKLTTIVSVVHVMENWLDSDFRTENGGAEIARIVQNACRLLGNFRYSASPDSVMHDQVFAR